MATHRMTPKRRAALKKAQAASARKRRGTGKGKLAKANRKSRRNGRIAAGIGVVAVAGAAAYAVHRQNKKYKAANAAYKKNTAKLHHDFVNAASKNSMKHVNFGLSRKQRARGKAAAAAAGTKGNRVFVSKNNSAQRKLQYRHEARLRQHRKAGDRGMYNAGLGTHGTKSHVMGTGKKRKRR